MIEVFLSYSHKDSVHKESLETHLSLMRRNKIIDTWSDREIIPGQEWGSQINEKLESAQVILFLVSSDFIASDYCIDIEVKRAIERHNHGDAIVVPIIVRPCDWKESILGTLQALPSNVEPVTKWDDVDEAWLDVVEGLKKSISLLTKNKSPAKQPNSLWSSNLNSSFKKWVEDTEVELSHRYMENIKLSDIFIYQDLRVLDHAIDEVSTTISSSDDRILEGWNIIFGEEQTGKTSLCKTLFANALKSKHAPLLVNGSEINNSDVYKIVQKTLKCQYLDCDIDVFKCQSNKILIIDDYSKTKLNKKHQTLFIDNAKQFFDSILIIADDSFQYVVPDIASLDGFNHYELMLFGNKKRYELIKQWVELGVTEEINEDQLYQNIDHLKQHADAFVRNNTVPSKPIYLLTVLQTFESYSPLGVELTSYGHCYQYLIYKALEKSHIRQQELESYINFLTELAGFMFSANSPQLSESDIESFFASYNKKYLSLQRRIVIEKLINSSILIESDTQYKFKYRYIYYFYAAKFLSENLTKSDENKEKIHKLINNLHKEDSANIIIFITHHTKDSWIIDEIQLSMMELFEDQVEARLTSTELAFMKEFIAKIPELVLEQREIESERSKDNLAKDEAEIIENRIDETTNAMEPNEILAKINRTFKALEIAGQILRNRHGSLDRTTLISLLEQSYNVGLRFLHFFLELSDCSKDEIVDVLKHLLTKNPNITNDRLEKEARNLFLLLTYGVIFGVLRKIAFSVGTKELGEIYDIVGNKIDSPAALLINQSIELQFMKKLDVSKIGKLYQQFQDNPACGRVLKEIVVQYIYMHHVGYKEKQQISEAIGLPIDSQLYLERSKSLKA